MKQIFKKRGSVLVFSLIILSIMLASALAITTATLSNRKSASSTAESVRAFQVADSGIEQVLRKVYREDYTNLSDLDASCSAGSITFAVSGGTARVTFLTDTGLAIACNEPTWKSMLSKIKAEGTSSSGGTVRVIETAVAAPGDYQVSCFGRTCCRIATGTGATQCREARNSDWSTIDTYASDPWTTSTGAVYKLSCTDVDGGTVCCRVDTTTGAAECKHANNRSSASWTTFSQQPWTAGTNGDYDIQCGDNGGTSTACCRLDTSNGSTACKSTSGTGNAWSNLSSNPW